jgi:geranylgeranyl reductase family protein
MTAPFDVIVVGGGPGGSSAAAVALRRGLSVAQIDRYRFPRMKPCGGGVTIKSCNALPFDLAPAVRGESSEIELNVWEKRQNRITRRSSALLRMVVRPEFDNWMVSENLKESSFRFFDDERVTDIAYADGLFSVRTTNRVLRGRQLVGADGAYSVVNKLFRVTQPKGFATAVEVTLRRDDAALREPTAACFDFGAIASGYGWIFPKDDHWNVGLYTLGKNKNLRHELLGYIEKKGFRVTGDPLATFAAHRFPYGGYRVNVPSAPVYVVGDAGGFGDPLMGEGIYHAIESGKIAGETAADCLAGEVGHEAYYERLRPSVLRDTLVTYYVSREFYRNVDKALTILENPFVWRPFVEGYADGATFSRSIMRAWWLLPKSVALGRFRYRRAGVSQPLALGGPLRGLMYLWEPVLRRAQRRLGLLKF